MKPDFMDVQTTSIQLEAGWKNALAFEFDSSYMQDLKAFLVKEKKAGKLVYPPGPLIFNAFNSTPWDQVRVVIIGQDPYHGLGQAHGLSFSVPNGVPHPPSLRNIFKEIQSDLGSPIPTSGDLTHWAKQGVLLLNATLTVEDGKAGSHQNKGWEIFTDSVIQRLSNEKTGLVFILWGRFARNKVQLIDSSKHHVLESAHPSPLSAHSGFFGCRHFSQTNELLVAQGGPPINWVETSN
ncbi:MAG: hypothetical protein RL090_1794 [Bacteroidota bacterium]|jgi:uracil-DNA glycosylase